MAAGEIRRLKAVGIDPHKLKEGHRNADLFKDEDGNVFVKPQSGVGEGEPTGLNLNSLK